MSVNSSSDSFIYSTLKDCFKTKRNVSVYTGLFISYILLLPLFLIVLYMGYHRWRKQCSATSAALTSHSDVFTFNMVVLELIGILGSSFFCYGGYTDQLLIMTAGAFMLLVTSPGQTLFHLLTCVERYLAVVHPVTYMGLRRSGGVTIRNVSIVCVWLLCFVSVGLSNISNTFYKIYDLLFLVVSSIVVLFCSLSVLCTLIRPGPGEVGGNRERVDQSKQRAFYTIMAIMAALLSKFFSSFVLSVIYASLVLSYSKLCLMLLLTAWFSLPGSLVLPLLFLQRAGKLPGCKHNPGSG